VLLYFSQAKILFQSFFMLTTVQPFFFASAMSPSLKVDDLFYPAKVNLAMLYNGRGENDKAEKLFRDVVARHSELYEVPILSASSWLKWEGPKRHLGIWKRPPKACLSAPASSTISVCFSKFSSETHRPKQSCKKP
jgi:hypothetical protein